MNPRIPPEKALRQPMDSAMALFAVVVMRDPFVDEVQHPAFARTMDPLTPAVSIVDAHHRLKNRDMRGSTRDHSAPTRKPPL